MTYKLIQMFYTKSEIKKAMWFAQNTYPEASKLRAGQAFCNRYLKTNETWSELFYEENKEKAIQIIHIHCQTENNVQYNRGY